MTEELLTLTADIVSAHVSHNNVSISELPVLIRSTFDALQKLGAEPVAEAAAQQPAVSIRASVKPDYLVCLEDGKKLTMLKRYLRSNYDMSPEDYRAKWNLPSDYPMVAPDYAAKRRALAHAIGLGRKKAVDVAETGVAEAEPIVEAVKRGRKKLGIAVEKKPAASTAVAEKTPAAKPKTVGKPRAPKAG